MRFAYILAMIKGNIRQASKQTANRKRKKKQNKTKEVEKMME